jgi:DNA-binding response OmpR family regulator
MISAHPNAKELCLQAGANDFMAKPFDMEDILNTVNRLIKTPSN